MKAPRRIQFEILAVLGLAASLIGCTNATEANNYKFTVTISSNGVHYTGSSVIKIGAVDQRPSYIPYSPFVQGEAVPVTVANNQTIYVTFHADSDQSPSDISTAPQIYFSALRSGRMDIMSFFKLVRRERPKVEVPIGSLPMIIFFRNQADPSTVQRLDPNDLSAATGSNSKAISATFEYTEEPISQKIDVLLPWLKYYVDGRSFDGVLGAVKRPDFSHEMQRYYLARDGV